MGENLLSVINKRWICAVHSILSSSVVPEEPMSSEVRAAIDRCIFARKLRRALSISF